MNHYQKIAVLLIRLIGTALTFYGIVYVFFFVGNGFTSNNPNYFSLSFQRPGQETNLLIAGVFFVFIGTMVFLIGKPIGKFIGKGLDV